MIERPKQPPSPRGGSNPPTPPKPVPVWWKARWVPIVGVGILALLIGEALGSAGQSNTTAAAPKTVTVTAPAVTSVKPATARWTRAKHAAAALRIGA